MHPIRIWSPDSQTAALRFLQLGRRVAEPNMKSRQMLQKLKINIPRFKFVNHVLNTEPVYRGP